MEHEALLVKRLVREACEKAQGKPILEVKIVAAKCANVDEGLLRFYWDQYAADTVCHGARIKFQKVPFIQKCPYCGHVFPARKQKVSCPKCRAEHTATLMGDECALIDDIAVAV